MSFIFVSPRGLVGYLVHRKSPISHFSEGEREDQEEREGGKKEWKTGRQDMAIEFFTQGLKLMLQQKLTKEQGFPWCRQTPLTQEESRTRKLSDDVLMYLQLQIPGTLYDLP